MADVDIDPFRDHDKTESRMNHFLSFQKEDQLGNQSMNKKHYSEEKVKELELKKTSLKNCMKKYLKSMQKIQKYFISMISTSEMGNCTTKINANP